MVSIHFLKTPFVQFSYFFSLLGKRDEEEIRFLSRGDYFGEQALLRTDFRTANVVANSTTVECLVLDRE